MWFAGRGRDPLAGISRAATALLAVAALLCAPLAAGGCGGQGRGSEGYVLKEGGVEVGSEVVTTRTSADRVTLSSTARRPYLERDTTVRTVMEVAPSDLKLTRYRSRTSVPGAVFTTYLERVAGTGGGPDSLDYLRDELQTYEQFEWQPLPIEFLPFERESAVTAQLFVDRYRASGERDFAAWAMVPSKSPVVVEANFKAKGSGKFSVRMEATGDFDFTYDEASGVLRSFSDRARTCTVALGDADLPPSEAYAPERFREEEVSVRTIDNVMLAGSLYLPDGDPPYHAAILVGDFGPNDRTGGGLLAQVANSLTARGLAVLTMDRRGIPKSKGAYSSYIFRSLTDDIDSQVEYMFMRGDIDPEHIYLVGYGEGGVAAIEVAGENPYVSRCVLMATPALRVYPELAFSQAEEAENTGELTNLEMAVRKADISRNLATLSQVSEDYVRVFDHPVFLAWMRSYMGFDPVAAARSIPVPVLVLQGTGDTKVTPDQAGSLMSALQARPGGKQELVMFDGLDHGFGPYRGQARSKPQRSHPVVDRRVLDTIGRWLEAK